MAGAIFQYMFFFRPRLWFYRGDFRGLGGESPVAPVYFFRWNIWLSNKKVTLFLLGGGGGGEVKISFGQVFFIKFVL